MNIKKFLNKISVFLLTFFIGLSLVFCLNSPEHKTQIQFEYAENNSVSGVKFLLTEEQILSLFEADGFYYFQNENPVGFEEIKHFRIKTKTFKLKDKNSEIWKPVTPEGFIQTDKKFDFKFMKINSNKIDFATEEINGLKYQFSGCYVDTKYLSYPKKNNITLVGHLVKKQSGIKIAETKFDLGWYADLLCSL